MSCSPHFGKVIKGEEALLKLASYSDMTNGIFYALPFQFEFANAQYVYVRYELLATQAHLLTNKLGF